MKHWSPFSTSLSTSSLLEVHLDSAAGSHILPVPLPRSEVSVRVSGRCSEVVSHFSHCFSWNPPAGPARGISPECVIYGRLTDDGCAVS